MRTYHDLQDDDRSAVLAQVVAQRARVAARLASVRHIVAVVSGKGGVGKSWVTALLAEMLAPRLDDGVAVLDADLKSPTIARMLAATGPLEVTEDGVRPATSRTGIAVMSTDLLLAESAPLAWRTRAAEGFSWRGLLEAGVLREFMADVVWGRRDLLLVDMPPDVDRLDDLETLVAHRVRAVVVTIPTEESRRSVARAMRRAVDAGIPILGIIENMSGYACGGCGETGPLFPGDAGDSLSAEFGVPLLGRLPFVPQGQPPGTATALGALGDAMYELVR
jgi:Mrp family chromosome partitioning ATPase